MTSLNGGDRSRVTRKAFVFLFYSYFFFSYQSIEQWYPQVRILHNLKLIYVYTLYISVC